MSRFGYLRTPLPADASAAAQADAHACLLDSLGIRGGITLVLHDWGGMIGMAYATRHPERIKRLNAAGLDHLLSLMQADRIPHAAVMKSIELFGKHVMPRFR